MGVGVFVFCAYGLRNTRPSNETGQQFNLAISRLGQRARFKRVLSPRSYG